MSEQMFEDRVARLEEHIVSTPLTAEECLDRAEQALARGWETTARSWLRTARIIHATDETRRLVDEWEAEDDDA